jgi:hypothetical protein
VLGRQNFQSDHLSQQSVPGPIDYAHPASTDLVENLVIAYVSTGGGRSVALYWVAFHA